ncbi:uncharacterized protein LOC144363028 [Saccoglossus kowalevskii]
MGHTSYVSHKNVTNVFVFMFVLPIRDNDIREIKRDDAVELASMPFWNSTMMETSTLTVTTTSFTVERNETTTIKTSMEVTLEDLLDRFPWIQRKRFTPNHFMYRHRGETSPVPSYKDHSIVFLHNHKSGGTTMKTCLQKIIEVRSLAPYYGLWNDNVVRAIETARTLEEKSRLYVTPYAFGLCDTIDEPRCSYFTVLRDPYERVISSYEYCKKARVDPHCAASDARQLSLKEWVLHQGSYFFRQLLFNPEEICSDLTRRQQVVKLIDKDEYLGRKRRYPPCWYRHKLLLDDVITKQEKQVILQYMLDNLENWFTAIGITEEYDTTLRLLQTVFKLPFYWQCSGLVEQRTKYSMQKQSTLSKFDAMAKSKQSIENDPEVFSALYYDIMIYRKAMEIFDIQKKVYFGEVMESLGKQLNKAKH